MVNPDFFSAHVNTLDLCPYLSAAMRPHMQAIPLGQLGTTQGSIFQMRMQYWPLLIEREVEYAAVERPDHFHIGAGSLSCLLVFRNRQTPSLEASWCHNTRGGVAEYVLALPRPECTLALSDHKHNESWDCMELETLAKLVELRGCRLSSFLQWLVQEQMDWANHQVREAPRKLAVGGHRHILCGSAWEIRGKYGDIIPISSCRQVGLKAHALSTLVHLSLVCGGHLRL